MILFPAWCESRENCAAIALALLWSDSPWCAAKKTFTISVVWVTPSRFMTDAIFLWDRESAMVLQHRLEQAQKHPQKTQALITPQPAQNTLTPMQRRLIQQAITAPSPRTLTPDVMQALRASHGGEFVQRLRDRSYPSQRLTVQANLTVTPAGDQYEQEADRVAEHVVQQMHAPTPPLAVVPTAQRQSDAAPDTVPMQCLQRLTDEEKDDVQMMRLQRQAVDPLGGLAVSPDVESSIQAARGGGAVLPASVRGAMEHAFGADFRQVRVHTGAESNALNRALQARAFTTGQDIFFRQGEYQPGSTAGQQLLAHELTHVVQQGHAARKIQRHHNLSFDDTTKTDSYIYGIYKKTTGAIVYVGQTCEQVGLAKRFQQHLSAPSDQGYPWYGTNGSSYSIKILEYLENVTKFDTTASEQFWWEHHGGLNGDLLNKNQPLLKDTFNYYKRQGGLTHPFFVTEHPGWTPKQ